MRIVLTNDDGFESVNIQALFAALKAAGHDVIMSAPYRNMSATSALLSGIPERTATPSSGGTFQTGSPGVGVTTLGVGQYYVDGSPASAVLYGLEVLANAKWNRAPDLVLSGPNIGNNLGVITPYSGTVGAAISALNRDVPAIAVSGANGDPATAALLAQITLRVVEAVAARGTVSLPARTGLSINVPVLDPLRSATSYPIAFTQISTEESIFATGDAVTVSPIQGTYEASPATTANVFTTLGALFSSVTTTPNATLVNVSVRGMVNSENEVLVAGFIVSGSSPKTLLIRASGPSLGALGVKRPLEDPALDIIASSGAEPRLVASNDNWSDDAVAAEEIAKRSAKLGAFNWVRGSKDAALIVTLAPGNYSALLRSANLGSGIGVLEVYDLGSN